MSGIFVEVTLKLRVEFDSGTLPWLEELGDKGREQAEIVLLKVDGVPSTIVLEGNVEHAGEEHV